MSSSVDHIITTTGFIHWRHRQESLHVLPALLIDLPVGRIALLDDQVRAPAGRTDAVVHPSVVVAAETFAAIEGEMVALLHIAELVDRNFELDD